MLIEHNKSIFLGEVLEKKTCETSAPARIDCGGTLDIKAIALTLQQFTPSTVNFAVDMRTYISLRAYKLNMVKVTSCGFAKEEYQFGQAPFDTPLGYFFAILSFFNVHGVEVVISSTSPLKSALGGSSAAGIALIYALSKTLDGIGEQKLSKKQMVHLAYYLEDSVGVSFCGMQDHLAACYGGVNQWIWKYSLPNEPFNRVKLLDNAGCNELSPHLLIAYSGEVHNSVEINLKWTANFHSAKNRDKWVELIQHVDEFADSIKHKNWGKAISALRKEMRIRMQITPECMIPLTKKLLHTANQAGCAARFAGAGGGGCFWALGELKDIEKLTGIWECILPKNNGARLLNNKIAEQGVI